METNRNKLETNPYESPSAKVSPATRKPVPLKRPLFVCVFALAVILLSPFPAIDVMVGGLAGTMLAQLFFFRQVGLQVIGGLVGGFVAFAFSLLVSAIVSGGVPQIVTSWWDFIWLPALMIWSVPGILFAMLIMHLGRKGTV